MAVSVAVSEEFRNHMAEHLFKLHQMRDGHIPIDMDYVIDLVGNANSLIDVLSIRIDVINTQATRLHNLTVEAYQRLARGGTPQSTGDLEAAEVRALLTLIAPYVPRVAQQELSSHVTGHTAAEYIEFDQDTHELKTWPLQFQEVWEGRKLAEIRKNDRDFKVGDRLLLREYDPATQGYTLRWMKMRITSTLVDFAGIEPGYIMMTMRELARFPVA